MKRLLFLGAAPGQLAPIHYARTQGHYVITTDYLPDNPGHALADESYTVSTTDKQAVLQLARQQRIDGIVAYASDPAAPVAAYVAQQLGLPGNSPQAVETLANKALFRDFLAKQGFRVPRARAFRGFAGVSDWAGQIGLPVFVKPTDSSGSKGVRCVSNMAELEAAFAHALAFSREGRVLIEQAIARAGPVYGGDVFFDQGKIQFCLWGRQYQDEACHPYAPVGMHFPAGLPEQVAQQARLDVQTVLQLLHIKTGGFNIEFVLDAQQQIWLIEIGPRNGGNLIPQVQKLATGFDAAAATVDAALGKPLHWQTSYPPTAYCAYYALHARRSGRLQSLRLLPGLQQWVQERLDFVRPGDVVQAFEGSHHTLGLLVLCFPDAATMHTVMLSIEQEIAISVTPLSDGGLADQALSPNLE